MSADCRALEVSYQLSAPAARRHAHGDSQCNAEPGLDDRPGEPRRPARRGGVGGGRGGRGAEARLAMMHAVFAEDNRGEVDLRDSVRDDAGGSVLAARAQLTLCAGTLRPKAKRQLAAELRVLEVRRPDKCR